MKLYNIIVSILYCGNLVSAHCHRCVSSGQASGPGVGPTYDAGKSCGFKHYIKTWDPKIICPPQSWYSTLEFNSCFNSKCQKAGKNYLYKPYY